MNATCWAILQSQETGQAIIILDKFFDHQQGGFEKLLAMTAKKNAVILLPALGVAHESQSGRLRTKILDDSHLFLHKVVYDLFGQRKILPQYVYAAIRIDQTLRYNYDLLIFFTHTDAPIYF